QRFLRLSRRQPGEDRAEAGGAASAPSSPAASADRRCGPPSRRTRRGHRGRGAEGGAEAPRHRRARPAPLIIERSQFFEVTGLHTACSRPKAGITGERKNFTSLPTGETMSLSEMSLMNRLLTGAAVAALAVTLAA